MVTSESANKELRLMLPYGTVLSDKFLIEHHCSFTNTHPRAKNPIKTDNSKRALDEIFILTNRVLITRFRDKPRPIFG